MSHRLISAILAAGLAVAVLGATCSDSPTLPPAEALARSAADFRDLRSFKARFQITTDAKEFVATTEGEVAYESESLAYFTATYADDVPGQKMTELLVIPPNLYQRGPDGQWYVLSPWNQGIRPEELPEDGLDDQFIAYDWIVDGLSDVERIEDETIDGEDYLHYAGTVSLSDGDPGNFVSAAPPTIMGSRSPGSAQATAQVEFWLHKDTYLPGRVRISVSAAGQSGSGGDATFDYFDYNQQITLPEPPKDTRPWRDLQLPEAPCTGSEFASCLEAQSELQSISRQSCEGSERRVCLVPLGQVSPALVQQLAVHYRDQYGLSVTVLTPVAVPADIANPLREQVDAGMLIDYMGQLFLDEYADANAVLIGITPVDLYDQESHFRYVFGVKGTVESPHAMLSTFRMNPEAYGEPPDDSLLISRTRKLLSKYIGMLYYGLETSPDPMSPLYDSILGPSDLDNMQEPLPVP